MPLRVHAGRRDPISPGSGPCRRPCRGSRAGRSPRRRAGSRGRAAAVRTTAARGPTHPPVIGTTRMPVSRWPTLPPIVGMNTICMTAKIASVSQECSSELYGAKSSAMSIAAAQSMAIAAMRRPTRPTEPGPDSGSPSRSPRPPARLEVAEGLGFRVRHPSSLPIAAARNMAETFAVMVGKRRPDSVAPGCARPSGPTPPLLEISSHVQ